MSAGGISLDCLTTSRKATLPSVEDWGSNLNILQDPHKSLYTKKKERVGDTNDILMAQEDSGDRIRECINIYPRGVNPMVSVNYNNYGKSQLTSSLKTSSHGGTILPYRSEVIRPPVLRQENLVPLSRQPRDWFYATTSVSAPAVFQEMKCSTEKKSIRPEVVEKTATANKTYVRQYPLSVDDTVDKKEVHHENITPATTTAKSMQTVASTMVEKHDPKFIHHAKTFHVIDGKKTGLATKEGVTKKNTKPNLKDNLHLSHVKTSKGTSQRIKTIHPSKSRREGKNPRLYSSVAVLPFYKIETPQPVVNTTKNIQEIPQLPDGVHMSKKSDRFAMTFDASNIKTNPKLCTTMEINPTKQKFVHPHDNSVPITLPIHEQTLLYSCSSGKQASTEKSPFAQVDISKIPVKNPVVSEAYSQKTGKEQNHWIGKDRVQRKRTVDILDTKTVQTTLKPPTSAYTIQETDHHLSKRAYHGSFDPTPQSVSRDKNQELNFTNSKQISKPKNREAEKLLHTRGTKY